MSQPPAFPPFSTVEPSRVEPPVPARSIALLIAGSAAAGALVAIPAAWVWSKVSDPTAKSLVTQGLACAEAELNHHTRITFWYIVIGVVVGLVGGFAIGMVGRRTGVATVAATLVFTAVAATVVALLGLHTFGPADADRFKCAFVGYLLENKLTIDTFLAYLLWPIGGLVGLCGAAFLWRDERNPPPLPPSSSSLLGQSPTG